LRRALLRIYFGVAHDPTQLNRHDVPKVAALKRVFPASYRD
jgi:hypothetical protein